MSGENKGGGLKWQKVYCNLKKNALLQAGQTIYIVTISHIYFGAGLRKISDDNGFTVWLTPEWHNMSSKGVHFNRQLDLHLKRLCQQKYEETHTRAEFMQLIGKNYLD